MVDTVSQSSSEHTAGSEYYDRWKGIGLKEIYGSIGPWNYNITPVAAAEDHILLCEIPVDLSAPPKPRSDANKQFWHDDFVRMPFADQCFWALESDASILCLATKWRVIRTAFSRPIVNLRDFENAVKKYNSDLPRFRGLKCYLKTLDDEDRSQFFSIILPGVVQLALQLPKLFPCGIPLLKRNKWCSLTMSQEQISSILCNGFLCTYTTAEEDHYNPNYPYINFARLFSSKREPPDSRIQNMVVEKIKCLMTYFKRVVTEAPKGIITFERKYIKDSDMPIWEKNDTVLGGTKVHLSAHGSIEDNGKGLCQVSFANRYIGGGVLGFGCVQEEIRFITYPELIAARLFTEVLGPNEVLLTIGAERYSSHTGYSNYFKFMGNCKDDTPYDNYGRRKLNIVSMDATKFNTVLEQFREDYIRKELNKAYVGFFSSTGSKQPIATGNWGCGAFRGDPFLKAMIQYLACSVTGRNLAYYTFGSANLQNEIYKCFKVVVDKKLTIAQLYKILIQYDRLPDRPVEFLDYFCPAVYKLKSNPIARMLGLSGSSQAGESTTFCTIKCIDPCGSPSYGSSREDINKRRSQE